MNGQTWRRPALLVPALIAAMCLLAVAAPGLIAPIDPNAVAPRDAFLPPGPQHWFGTDESGRDVYSRVVWGARPSLVIGLSATAIGLGIGTAIGVAAGSGGRLVDAVAGRVIEVAFAFPGLLLALLVIVISGPGPVPATIAVGLSTAPGYARIIRGQLIGVRASAYTEAAVALGHSPARVLARTVLPNTLSPLLSLATLGVGQAIVWASALSFLGLGAQPPAAEWGAMLAAGRTYIATAPWLTIAPGTAIVLLAVAATAAGRAIRTGGER